MVSKLQGETRVTNLLNKLNPIRRSQFTNEDPVICVICFSKQVEVATRVLQHKKISPFGEHLIVD